MLYFIQKLPVFPLKINCLPLFEIKIFWPATTDILLKDSPPVFWKIGCKCYDIAKSAGSQTIN